MPAKSLQSESRLALFLGILPVSRGAALRAALACFTLAVPQALGFAQGGNLPAQRSMPRFPVDKYKRIS